jgi:hypothetical protein
MASTFEINLTMFNTTRNINFSLVRNAAEFLFCLFKNVLPGCAVAVELPVDFNRVIDGDISDELLISISVV